MLFRISTARGGYTIPVKRVRGHCCVGLTCLRPGSLHTAAERQKRRCPRFDEHALTDGEPCGGWRQPREGPASGPQVVWAALFLNVLAFAGLPTLIPIPPRSLR